MRTVRIEGRGRRGLVVAVVLVVVQVVVVQGRGGALIPAKSHLAGGTSAAYGHGYKRDRENLMQKSKKITKERRGQQLVLEKFYLHHHSTCIPHRPEWLAPASNRPQPTHHCVSFPSPSVSASSGQRVSMRQTTNFNCVDIRPAGGWLPSTWPNQLRHDPHRQVVTLSRPTPKGCCDPPTPPPPLLPSPSIRQRIRNSAITATFTFSISLVFFSLLCAARQGLCTPLVTGQECRRNMANPLATANDFRLHPPRKLSFGIGSAGCDAGRPIVARLVSTVVAFHAIGCKNQSQTTSRGLAKEAKRKTKRERKRERKVFPQAAATRYPPLSLVF